MSLGEEVKIPCAAGCREANAERYLPPDASDLLSALALFHVPFLIVGAHALHFHSYPRPTRDLDLFLDPASNPIPALHHFGIPDLDTFPPDSILRFGPPHNRIDLTNTLESLPFHDAWPNRISSTLAGCPVHFLSLPDLLSQKLAASRPKDHLDALHLLHRLRTHRP